MRGSREVCRYQLYRVHKFCVPHALPCTHSSRQPKSPLPPATNPNRQKGFAYVEFETDAGVQAAVAKNGAVVKGRTLDVSKSRPPKGPDDHTAFVKGMGYDVGEEDLRELFADAPGGVKGLRVPRDDTGRCKVRGWRPLLPKFTALYGWYVAAISPSSKLPLSDHHHNRSPNQGFAYVEFVTSDGLAAAVAKDGVEVKGRQLLIAKSAPPGPAGGRGGGRDGRGRGGRFDGGRGGRFGGRFDGGGRGGRFDSGRGGGRFDGGRGGGRGRPGLGAQRDEGTGHMHSALQTQDAGGAGAPAPAPIRGLVPRALVRGAADGAQLPANDGKAKSNDEFRKMLFAKK